MKSNERFFHSMLVVIIGTFLFWHTFNLYAEPIRISSAIIPGKSIGPFQLGMTETEIAKLAKKLGLTAEIDKEDEVGLGIGIYKGTQTIVLCMLDKEVGEGKVIAIYRRHPYFLIKNTNIHVGSPFKEASRILGKHLLIWDEGWTFLFKQGLEISVNPYSMDKSPEQHLYKEEEYGKEIKNSKTTRAINSFLVFDSYIWLC